MSDVSVDKDIRGFSDEQLVGCIALAELMLRNPELDDDKRETLVRRLGMFRVEKAIRDDTATNIEKWERIIVDSQADGVNPFA